MRGLETFEQTQSLVIFSVWLEGNGLQPTGWILCDQRAWILPRSSVTSRQVVLAKNSPSFSWIPRLFLVGVVRPLSVSPRFALLMAGNPSPCCISASHLVSGPGSLHGGTRRRAWYRTRSGWDTALQGNDHKRGGGGHTGQGHQGQFSVWLLDPLLVFYLAGWGFFAYSCHQCGKY